ncbi:hypothetical protein AMTR_s00064p00154150, partial [Amborella trichopoda]
MFANDYYILMPAHINKWAKKYRNKSLRDIDSLGQIFGGTIAEGRDIVSRGGTVLISMPVSTTPPIDSVDSSLQDEIDEGGESSSDDDRSHSKKSRSQTPTSRSKKKSSPSEVIAKAIVIVAK